MPWSRTLKIDQRPVWGEWVSQPPSFSPRSWRKTRSWPCDVTWTHFSCSARAMSCSPVPGSSSCPCLCAEAWGSTCQFLSPPAGPRDSPPLKRVSVVPKQSPLPIPPIHLCLSNVIGLELELRVECVTSSWGLTTVCPRCLLLKYARACLPHPPPLSALQLVISICALQLGWFTQGTYSARRIAPTTLPLTPTSWGAADPSQIPASFCRLSSL